MRIWDTLDKTRLFRAAASGATAASLSFAHAITTKALPLLALNRPIRAVVPPWIQKEYHFRWARHQNGRKIFLLRPKQGAVNPMVILYLHGGAYTIEFFTEHWFFIGRLAEELGCTVVAPDYPLLPGGNYRSVFAMIDPIYRTVLKKSPPEQVVVMGDSAGGGMALALCQKMAREGVPQPGWTVLLSPWLDVSMENPEILQVQKKDRLLWPELRRLGRLYAAGASLRNPLISPLYGPVEGLGNITLFTGTCDILNPDARKWVEIANAQGFLVDYREYIGMPHDWVLFHEASIGSQWALRQYGRESMQRCEQARQEVLDLLRRHARHLGNRLP